MNQQRRVKIDILSSFILNFLHYFIQLFFFQVVSFYSKFSGFCFLACFFWFETLSQIAEDGVVENNQKQPYCCI